jgi:hypothetical protein
LPILHNLAARAGNAAAMNKNANIVFFMFSPVVAFVIPAKAGAGWKTGDREV